MQTLEMRNWRSGLHSTGRASGHTERFRRVISFEDISFDSSQYRISVHYSYCYLKNGCQVLSDAGVFVASFEDGKLTFLEAAGMPNQ